MTITLLLLMACGPAEPPPAPDIDGATASVIASLGEAARLDLASQEEDARTSWRRAHVEFDTVVEPALRTRLPANDVTTLELRFGLFRDAIEAPRGSSRQELRSLTDALQAAKVRYDELDPNRDPNEPDTEAPSAGAVTVRRPPPE